MNKTVIRTMLVCVALPLLFFFMYFIGDPFAKDHVTVMGLSFAVAGLVYFIPGVILAIIPNTRKTGQGVLLSATVLLVVGIALCSVQPINFH